MGEREHATELAAAAVQAIRGEDGGGLEMLKELDATKDSNELKRKDVFFSSKNLKQSVEDCYVLNVDIMGIGCLMKRSFNQSLIVMGKFHAAMAEELARNALGFFAVPVIDGAYVASPSLAKMINFTCRLYTRLGTLLTKEREAGRFLIRGGLSYGSIFKGAYLPPNANNALANATAYKSQLLFGTPLSFAHDGESLAPPFGVFIDELARNAAFKICADERPPLSGTLYYWCRKNEVLRKEIAGTIKNYFQYAREHSLELMYDDKKIDEHEKAAGQYWGFEVKK